MAVNNKGAELWLGLAANTLEKVANLTSVTPPGKSRTTLDATTHDSVDDADEVIVDGVVTSSEITATIDYEAGLLTRRIETLQLWRVLDIDLRQTFMQRLLDVAEIRVFTKDASDPELVIRGLPASRELFEALKNAAELARQQRVLGVVQ